MPKHGGKRSGAGRPKGRRDTATIEQKATIEELARAHAPAAIQTLVSIAATGESEAARVSAANAILDRGYGKAKQTIAGDMDNPIEIIRRVIVDRDGELPRPNGHANGQGNGDARYPHG